MADTQPNPLQQYIGKSIEIDPEVQKRLNQPLAAPEVNQADREFLNMVINKVNKKEINLFVPSLLINPPVYDQLSDEMKALAEINAFNFLTEIRNIKSLYDAGMTETYQMQNMVHHLRVIKERLEELGGDIFVI